MTQEPRMAAIDQVARAMTAGAPAPDFADRVMAPIYGRPRRDFVARVMAGLDAAPARAPRRVAAVVFGPGFAAAALALVALAVVWPRIGPLPNLPASPAPSVMAAEPRIASSPPVVAPERTPVTPPRAESASLASAAAAAVYAVPRADAAVAPRDTRPSPLDSMEALEGPPAIAVSPVEPAPMLVPPLVRPRALTIPTIRSQKEIR